MRYEWEMILKTCCSIVFRRIVYLKFTCNASLRVVCTQFVPTKESVFKDVWRQMDRTCQHYSYVFVSSSLLEDVSIVSPSNKTKNSWMEWAFTASRRDDCIFHFTKVWQVWFSSYGSVLVLISVVVHTITWIRCGRMVPTRSLVKVVEIFVEFFHLWLLSDIACHVSLPLFNDHSAGSEGEWFTVNCYRICQSQQHWLPRATSTFL